MGEYCNTIHMARSLGHLFITGGLDSVTGHSGEPNRYNSCLTEFIFVGHVVGSLHEALQKHPFSLFKFRLN